MKLHFLKPISCNIGLVFICFFCNKIICKTDVVNYLYTLESIYFFFTFSLIIILFTSHLIHQKNKDIVGIVYLFTTGIKLILSYILFKSVIDSSNENNLERINIFMVFILFLVIETISTIRLLNKK
jgi:hypothetical protein